MKDTTIWTIGHSNHTLERFLELLSKHSISSVVDVRSQPYSRANPQFNREALLTSLKDRGLSYVFLGDSLGGRSNNKACYQQGRVQYRCVAATRVFQAGIQLLLKEGQLRRLVLMCAEREPLECHRTLLVARELVNVGARVAHIHADGHVEPHEEAVRRLVEMLVDWPEQEDLLRSRSQLVEEAYARQEARVAFVDERLASEVDQVTA